MTPSTLCSSGRRARLREAAWGSEQSEHQPDGHTIGRGKPHPREKLVPTRQPASRCTFSQPVPEEEPSAWKYPHPSVLLAGMRDGPSLGAAGSRARAWRFLPRLPAPVHRGEWRRPGACPHPRPCAQPHPPPTRALSSPDGREMAEAAGVGLADGRGVRTQLHRTSTQHPFPQTCLKLKGFPGGPVVRIPRFQRRGPSAIPGRGTGSHMPKLRSSPVT